MKANRGLTIERMVELGSVSRASFYRFEAGRQPRPDRDMDLRDAIQRLALEWPSYGRPRITAELRRRGWKVNPKRVYRLMREDNLLCVRKRKFVVTTDSNHNRKVYPNLAGEMVLTGIDQLWVADITYIRLESEFVYLAVVIDAYSRRVIGWALEQTVEDDLPLRALRKALELRQPVPGVVHHSDRGSQYASGDYTDLLKAHGCQISMSHRASPWENAGCESWMKTLKSEEVYRQEYRDLGEARASIAQFIDEVYNQKRLHSALGYRPPVEFEQVLAAPGRMEAQRMTLTHRGRGERESRTGDGAAQVVVGVAVAAGKLWAGEAENFLHLGGRPMSREQVPGDPTIDDAPVGLGEALADVPALHASPIDLHRHRRGDGGGGRVFAFRVDTGGQRGGRRCQSSGRSQQCPSLRRQAGLCAHNLHPGGVAARRAACGLLIGETGEPAQVAPVGAGRIAPISRCQQFAGGGRHRRLQGGSAEMNPGLQVSGAGLHDHTGIMPLGVHGGHGRRSRAIQVDENVAGIMLAGIGLHIDIATFAVAHTQEADRGRAGQLLGCPKPFTRERLSGPVMDQADQVQITGHGGELSANAVQGEKETAVFHDRNLEVETNRRTMNFQRTANGVLTVCLNRGGRRMWRRGAQRFR